MKPDQTDIVAENARLKTELTEANTRLASAGDQITSLNATIAKGEEQLKAATDRAVKAEGELASAQARITEIASENDRLRSEVNDANARAARIVVGAGIVGGLKGQSEGAGAEKPKTLTERCLAAKLAK